MHGKITIGNVVTLNSFHFSFTQASNVLMPTFVDNGFGGEWVPIKNNAIGIVVGYTTDTKHMAVYFHGLLIHVAPYEICLLDSHGRNII